VCASEGCGSSRGAQQSTYSHVKRALFSSHSKIYHLRRNPRPLRSVVAQFIGLPFVIARLTKSAEAIPVGTA